MTAVERPPVSRLPLAADPPTDLLARTCYERSYKRGREPLNLHKALSHAPEMLNIVNELTIAIRFKSSLPRDMQELIILKVAAVAHGDYVRARHAPLAMGWGASRERVDAVPRFATSDLFDAKEKAMLAYVDAIAKNEPVDAALFTGLTPYFSSKEIVEITVSAAGYLAVSRAGNALGLKPDPGHDPDKPSKHQ